MSDDLNTGMVAFVQAVTTTMGLSLNVNIGPIEDGTRITLDGEGVATSSFSAKARCSTRCSTSSMQLFGTSIEAPHRRRLPRLP